MVVHSKEMTQVCGNCEAKLDTAFFRCTCRNCDPRGSFEDGHRGPLDRPPCPRGGFASRGRSFHDHSSHLSCPRGAGFSPRGGHFASRPQSPYDRPNFATTAPFPGVSRGCGFVPRGFGGCPPRCLFPETFGPMAEDFSPMMRGRGGFGPFAGSSRGRAGFPQGLPEMGVARGRGGCRGRGGLRPFCGAKGMGCGECNHESVFPEVVKGNTHDPRGESCPGAAGPDHEANTHDPRGETCPGAVGSDHEANTHDPRGETCPGAVGPDHEANTHDPRGETCPGAVGSDDKEDIPDDPRGEPCAEPINVDHEG